MTSGHARPGALLSGPPSSRRYESAMAASGTLMRSMRISLRGLRGALNTISALMLAPASEDDPGRTTSRSVRQRCWAAIRTSLTSEVVGGHARARRRRPRSAPRRSRATAPSSASRGFGSIRCAVGAPQRVFPRKLRSQRGARHECVQPLAHRTRLPLASCSLGAGTPRRPLHQRGFCIDETGRPLACPSDPPSGRPAS